MRIYLEAKLKSKNLKAAHPFVLEPLRKFLIIYHPVLLESSTLLPFSTVHTLRTGDNVIVVVVVDIVVMLLLLFLL